MLLYRAMCPQPTEPRTATGPWPVRHQATLLPGAQRPFVYIAALTCQIQKAKLPPMTISRAFILIEGGNPTVNCACGSSRFPALLNWMPDAWGSSAGERLQSHIQTGFTHCTEKIRIWWQATVANDMLHLAASFIVASNSGCGDLITMVSGWLKL